MLFEDFKVLMQPSLKKGAEISQVYLALKVKSMSSWSFTIYLLDQNGALYEMDGSGTETKQIE